MSTSHANQSNSISTIAARLQDLPTEMLDAISTIIDKCEPLPNDVTPYEATITVKDGGYEYTDDVLFVVQPRQEPNDVAQTIALFWWYTPDEPTEGEYEESADEAENDYRIIEARFREIPRSEYYLKSKGMRNRTPSLIEINAYRKAIQECGKQ